MSLNTSVLKPNESLCRYVSRDSRLQYVATDKKAWENTDPMWIYHFVTSIDNTSIADKIVKQVWYVPRTLQDTFKRALVLEVGLQLSKGVHWGRSPQVMQISTSVSCHHNGLEGYVHARSNACWKCGGLGHFQKDCKASLNPQGGDRDDAALSDTNPTIGRMSHTVTMSMSITDLTFKAILKELVSLTIDNIRAFCSNPRLLQSSCSTLYKWY